MMIHKHCPECGTFTGGFGGRPDDNFCHNCGLNLKAKVYLKAEVEEIEESAWRRGIAEGRRLEAAEHVDPCRTTDHARKIGYEEGFKAGRSQAAVEARKHAEVV